MVEVIEEPHGPCENCRAREATVLWVGDGGVLGWVHGAYECWCSICALEKQLAHPN